MFVAWKFNIPGCQDLTVPGKRTVKLKSKLRDAPSCSQFTRRSTGGRPYCTALSGRPAKPLVDPERSSQENSQIRRNSRWESSQQTVTSKGLQTESRKATFVLLAIWNCRIRFSSPIFACMSHDEMETGPLSVRNWTPVLGLSRGLLQLSSVLGDTVCFWTQRASWLAS